MSNVDARMRDTFRWDRHPKGEVGLEIEVEGARLPLEVQGNWSIHQDGSLRNGGLEYVIAQPINRDNVRATLEGLLEQFQGARAAPLFSPRTSVHTHINIQDMTVRQWVNFITLFGIVEELLVDIVGPERAGNKFCLRFMDADAPLRAIRLGLQRDTLRQEVRGNFKYASCNIRATSTHGTLEFRAMEGNLDVDRINNWVQLLCALKDQAKAVKSPNILVEEMSLLSPAGFIRKYLPEGNPLTRAVMMHPRRDAAMYDGARVVQDIAYCTEWGEPQEFVGPRKKGSANLDAVPADARDLELADVAFEPAPDRRLRRAGRVVIDDFDRAFLNEPRWIIGNHE